MQDLYDGSCFSQNGLSMLPVVLYVVLATTSFYCFRMVGALFCDPPLLTRLLVQTLKRGFTTFEPPEAASWVLQYRTAWRTPRSAAASRRTSWHRGRRCVRGEFRSEGDPAHRSKCATRQHPWR